jgi:enamine deaminase RidA (YjgF/YER057c/UK114 family)
MSVVEHLNPEGLMRSPAFSQGVAVSGPHRTIYVGGQDAVDEEGRVVGDDLVTQTRRVLANLRRVLAAAGADLEHVVKWNVVVTEGQALQEGFAVFQEEWGSRPDPPAITVQVVAGLADPRFLVEIEAVAVVPA